MIPREGPIVDTTLIAASRSPKTRTRNHWRRFLGWPIGSQLQRLAQCHRPGAWSLVQRVPLANQLSPVIAAI